ncbi:MAG: toprim domain-containing protein, partial [Clostridia bacterium]|nr:toprim domain-containing protein [Clostridia bacterium]
AVKNNKGDGYYDAYRDRVMFPIIGTNGRVLGFGARTMGDEQPKYINTGDTPIFNKRFNLYALNLLKGKKVADLVLCEGYMDVISLHHAGVDNAVASLGTALTSSQARLIKRYVNTVYICYDGDAAGQNAALRGLDILAAEGLSVRVMRIPGGMDPDDYVKKYGLEGFNRLKEKALTLNAFKLEFMAGKYDLSTEDGRENFALEACAFIGTLQPVEQERYYVSLARKTGLPIEALKAQGANKGGSSPKNSFTKFRNTREKQREVPDDERFRAERNLIACLAQDYDTAMHVMQKITPDFFAVGAFERFATELLCAYAETEKPEVPLLLSELSPEDAELVAQALFAGDAIPEAKATADDCILRIEKIGIVERVRALTREAEREELSPERRSELTREILELQKRLRTRT